MKSNQYKPSHLKRMRLTQRSRLGSCLLLLLLSLSGLAQGVIGPARPGGVYPMFDWRSMPGGTLPQSFEYPFSEDRVRITVEDGARQGVGTDEMIVTLQSQVNWEKSIWAYNSCLGAVGRVSTKDNNRGPNSMRLFRNTRYDCQDGASTIIIQKAKTFGELWDMYHFDENNFWPIWGGKIVTFTWLEDSRVSNPYPSPCNSPCIPVGATRRKRMLRSLAADRTSSRWPVLWARGTSR